MIKVLRIFDPPESYLQSFLGNSTVAGKSYEERMNLFFNDKFGQSNFLSSALNELDFPTLDLIPNFESAQKSWAKERGVAFEETSWKLQILNEQIKHYKPEILFFVGWGYGYEFIKEIKEKHSCVKRVVLWIGESIPDQKFYQYYDAIITCDEGNRTYLEQQGIMAFQIHHAFSSELAKGFEDIVKQNQIGFAGSLKAGDSEHNYRAKILCNLLEEFDINAYGLVSFNPAYNTQTVKGRLIKSYHEIIGRVDKLSNNLAQQMPKYRSYAEMGKLIEILKMFEEIKEIIKAPLYGREYISFIKSSLIVLNSHSNTAIASNMRLFEVTGQGTCILTDYKENMSQLFKENDEVVCYRNMDELLE